MIKAAAVAAGALAIVATVTPVFAQGKEFPDVPPDHWAAQSVKLLEDRGIVIGYPDGTYGGPKAMTRYEFAEAIARLLPQIDQRIAEAIGKIPAPDLSNYVTKTDLDDILQGYAKKSDLDNYYTKAEADQRFATKADIDRIMGLLNQFRDELTALGVDVNALKRHYAALDARVTELEKLQVFGASTAALKVSNQFYGVGRGQQYAGVDEGGSLLDNGSHSVSGAGFVASQTATPIPLSPATAPGGSAVVPPLPELGTAGNAQGKHGILSDPSAFYDTQIGIQYAFSPRLRAVAQFIMGNYYGAWNEQQAFNASFNGGNAGLLGLRSNRQPGSLALQTYEAYLTSPFTLPVFPHAIANSAVSVGRIPTKMTPFTWWAVDPDPYINIAREDSGNITLTGGALSGSFKNWSVSVFGGYNPTDGTSPYTFASDLDPSRDG
ncbi:MAG TPA: S-layer homology domain-containing protein, partial [Armatimonadota bacterium]|nr:S-layer homology domain-containing protein [Armatimonadota bacterium]